MDRDYLLIGVDQSRRYAFRFLAMNKAVNESILIQAPQGPLLEIYTQTILASVLLGSRADDQESTLFKLKTSGGKLTINCEVSPMGVMRSAIFPSENKTLFQGDFEGALHVVRLLKRNEVYESITTIENSDVEETYREYLRSSVQTDSIFLMNTDIEEFRENYALWVEKLPGTGDAEWKRIEARFNDGASFFNSFLGTDDPDVIISRLLGEPFEILAVTNPRLYCPCSHDAIVRAIALLPKEDLVEIFMDGKGVESRCDYCHKSWKVSDEDIKSILNIGSMH